MVFGRSKSKAGDYVPPEPDKVVPEEYGGGKEGYGEGKKDYERDLKGSGSFKDYDRHSEVRKKAWEEEKKRMIIDGDGDPIKDKKGDPVLKRVTSENKKRWIVRYPDAYVESGEDDFDKLVQDTKKEEEFHKKYKKEYREYIKEEKEVEEERKDLEQKIKDYEDKKKKDLDAEMHDAKVEGADLEKVVIEYKDEMDRVKSDVIEMDRVQSKYDNKQKTARLKAISGNIESLDDNLLKERGEYNETQKELDNCNAELKEIPKDKERAKRESYKTPEKYREEMLKKELELIDKNESDLKNKAKTVVKKKNELKESVDKLRGQKATLEQERRQLSGLREVEPLEEYKRGAGRPSNKEKEQTKAVDKIRQLMKERDEAKTPEAKEEKKGILERHVEKLRLQEKEKEEKKKEGFKKPETKKEEGDILFRYAQQQKAKEEQEKRKPVGQRTFGGAGQFFGKSYKQPEKPKSGYIDYGDPELRRSDLEGLEKTNRDLVYRYNRQNPNNTVSIPKDTWRDMEYVDQDMLVEFLSAVKDNKPEKTETYAELETNKNFNKKEYMKYHG